jgi:6-hydroxynicotinate 3-monooxygenase
MPGPRIAIVGAGLGGTTLALFLQQAGYDATLYEQAPALARIGAGINLGPNVTRILRHLGLGERTERTGVIPRSRFSRAWDTGEITFEIPVGGFADQYGAPHLTMHRGDLQEALTEAVRPGSLHFRKRLVDVTDTETAVKLHFADDTSTTADIVIGADGINSRLREILLGPEQPIYTGTVAYRSIFPRALVGDMDIADHTKWWGIDRHILFYFLTHARDEIYFVTGVPEPDWGSDNFAPQPADMDRLRATFAGFHSDVRTILAACPAATRWPILERLPFPLWSSGRIVLLGDACHPMAPNMGQGAAMAIEDAAVLANCIIAHGGEDTASIFAEYQSKRFDRTARVQRESRENNWLRTPMDPGWLFGFDVLGDSRIASRTGTVPP